MKRKKSIALLLIAVMLAALLSGCTAFEIDISTYEYDPQGKTVIYSGDDEIIAEIYDENRTFVSIEDVPQDLINAIVSVEDRAFFEHGGVSIKGIVRAFFKNFSSGDMYGEGGSTITQQVVKHLFLTDEKTYMRKINEAILAMKMEDAFTKDEIMEIYINHMYLGAGAYGVQEASRTYFAKDVSELNLAECTLIAGLFQAPSAYDPFENYDAAVARQHIVINVMVEAEYISEEEAEEIRQTPITLSAEGVKGFQGVVRPNCSAFVGYVIEEYYEIMIPLLMAEYNISETAAEDMARRMIVYEGVTLNTTLNCGAQEYAVEAIESIIDYYGLDSRDATGALVSTDCTTGAIRAYYGGNTQIDMANSPRQPGSSIKPYYYAMAIEDGAVTSRTLINDTKTRWGDYVPENYGGGYSGYMTVRNALITSRNIPSVKIFNDLYGVQNSVDAVKKFGFTTVEETDYTIATATGGMTYGLKPVEMSAAFAAFENGGYLVDQYAIVRIVDKNGVEWFNISETERESERILSENTANTMNGMLRDVVSYGTGGPAYVSGYRTGGKTGTTNDEKDLWFAGFSANLSTAIWLGNLDTHPIGGSSSYCAAIFGRYMRNCVNNDILDIDDTYISPAKSMTQILVGKEALVEEGRVYFAEDEIETITVPEQDVYIYQDIMVEEVVLDSSSGKLFVEGKCPEKYRQEVYFLKRHMPQELCTKLHYLNDIFSDEEPNGQRENDWFNPGSWQNDGWHWFDRD